MSGHGYKNIRELPGSAWRHYKRVRNGQRCFRQPSLATRLHSPCIRERFCRENIFVSHSQQECCYSRKVSGRRQRISSLQRLTHLMIFSRSKLLSSVDRLLSQRGKNSFRTWLL